MTMPLRILFVEDSEPDVILLARHLRAAGIDLEHGQVDTSKALENALRTKGWDLVLCDFKLPGFDAFAALEIVQRISPDLPFFVLSGALSEDMLVNVMKAGAHDLILKSNLSRLIPAIKRELVDAEMRHAHAYTRVSLEESERRYELLYNKTPAMLWSLDADGKVITVSDHWLDHMGFERGEVLDRGITDFLTPDSARRMAEVVRPEYSRAGSCKDVELQFVKKNGDVIDVYLSAIAERNADGRIIRSLAVFRDITQRNIYAAKLDALVGDLQRANADLKRFAYVASHDLQEPLRKLEQFSGYLLADCAHVLSEDGKYFLDVIRRSSSRMSQLIRDLLSYSRTANCDLEPREVDLTEVTRSILSDLDVLVTDAKARIQVGALPVINGDPTAVTHLMRNLIGNAIKYRHPDRPPEIRISSTVSETDKSSEIVVADNGIGFEMKFKDRIFEPFRRLHDKESYPGSGIGLSVCKTICDRHGWRLHAVSQLDKGSTFSISIPLTDISPTGGDAE